MKTLAKFNSKIYINTVTFAIFLGICQFIVLWGHSPLNIYDWHWIIYPYGTDFSWTGLGTLSFLNSEWTFPFGYISNLIYPRQTSIVYIDSIPLFALIFKFISKICGFPIQYFGIWGLFSCVMQALLSALFFVKYTKNLYIILLCTSFLINSPFFLGKMFGHPSFAGQWVIIAAILLLAYRDNNFIKKNSFLIWCGILVLSLLINPYFAAMNGPLMILFCFLVYRHDINVFRIKVVKLSVISLIFLIISFWIVGGFTPGLEPSSNDYGLAPASINALFNPSSSYFIRSFPYSSGEAYSYLGTGLVLILVFLVLDYFLNNRRVILDLKLHKPFMFMIVLFLIFSMTNNIMLSDKIIFHYELPTLFISIFSTFRTSARFIWPVWFIIAFYLLSRIIIISKINKISEKNLIVLLSLLLSVQIFDNVAFFDNVNKGRINPQQIISNSDLTVFHKNLSVELSILPTDNVDFFKKIPWGGMYDNVRWEVVSALGIARNINLNYFWLGRYPISNMLKDIEFDMADLKNGIASDRALYFISQLDIIKQFPLEKFKLIKINDFYILLTPSLFNSSDFYQEHEVVPKKISVFDYFKSLTRLKNKLIVITARDSSSSPIDLPIADGLKQLGLSEFKLNNGSFNYMAIISSESGVITEKFSQSSLNYFNESSASDIPVKIYIDYNDGAFPNIKVNSLNCSLSYVGLNVCVYDRISHKLDSIGLFDTYANTIGLELSFNH